MTTTDSISDELLELHVATVPWTGPILERFGDPAAALRAGADELARIRGIGPATARQLRCRLDGVRADRIRRDLEARRIRTVFLGGADYPPELELMPDSPVVLFFRGEIPGPEITKIAIVGARRCSAYGRRCARRFAEALSHAGVAVTSGLARGIDIAAQDTALEGGGPVVAVLGSGLDVPYPPEHVEWIERIAERGAVVSEFPLGTPPRRENFPWRNRIISGLALAVIVVEATRRSGSLITARWALEQGREVFAIPGPIEAPGSEGPHALLRDGARLLESVADLAELLPELEAAPAGLGSGAGLDATQRRLLQLVTERPLPADVLARSLERTVESVLSMLVDLEIGGHVERVAGGRFARR